MAEQQVVDERVQKIANGCVGCGCLLLVVGVLGVGGVFAYSAITGEDVTTPRTKTVYSLNSGYFMAASEADLSLVTRAAADEDWEAVRRLELEGRARRTPAGKRCFIVDAHFRVHEVRVEGATETVWIPAGALRSTQVPLENPVTDGGGGEPR